MRDTILDLLTSRTAILIGNVLLLAMMIQGSLHVLSDMANLPLAQKEMEEVLEGLGTILVGLGVALEERETLLKFLGLYPARQSPLQSCVDHHCHGYGLVVLLLGLAVEVVVYLIRMPNIPTVDFDPALLRLAALLCLGGAFLLAMLSWRLLRAPAEAAA